MSSMSKFVFISTGFNTCDWVEANINSVKMLGCDHVKHVYINDCSTDNTKDILQDLQYDNLLIINNDQRRGALFNYFNTINSLGLDDEDIIMFLDGDDWLNEQVDIIDLYTNVYVNNNTLCTYGSIKRTNGVCEPWGAFDLNKPFRSQPWKGTAMRTCKYKIFKLLKQQDLLDKTGNYYQMAWDLAMFYPILEMSADRSKYISDLVYIYNVETPMNDHKIDREMQSRLDREIRSKKPYQPIIV